MQLQGEKFKTRRIISIKRMKKTQEFDNQMDDFNDLKKKLAKISAEFRFTAILFSRIGTGHKFQWQLDRNRKQMGAKGTIWSSCGRLLYL